MHNNNPHQGTFKTMYPGMVILGAQCPNDAVALCGKGLRYNLVRGRGLFGRF